MGDATVQTGAPERAGRREWLGLAVLVLPTLLLSLDISVLFLALPHLSADLGATGIQQLWITDSYGFMIAGFLITMGTLGDRIGRRRLLLIGAAAFGVASVLAAYSSSAEMLIATRAVLGIAGATLMPSTLALISTMFTSAKQRGTAISLWASAMMAGAALGPVVGGLLLEHFWWGSVFLMGVPVMVLLLVTGPRLLPEFRDPEAGRLDFVSVVLSLAAILPIVYGMKELAVYGADTTAVTYVVLVAGLVPGWLFVRRQRRLDSPMLDLRLFGNRSFTGALAMMLLGGAALAGTFLVVSQYVQTVLALSPAEAGLWLAPAGIGIAAGSMLAPAFASRVRPGTAIASGLACSALGFALITQVGWAGLAVVVTGTLIVHFGAGPMFTLGTGLVVGSAPPEQAGAAASMSETSNEFGVALGFAVFGSLSAAVYRNEITIPAGIPAETARHSIAGAAAAAEKLAAGPAAELLAPARAAFTSGLSVTATVSAVLFVGLAIMVATVLRHERSAEH